MNQILNIQQSTFITNNGADKNYGQSNQLYCYKNEGDKYRTLIKFDVDQELIDLNNNTNYKINLKVFFSVRRLKASSYEMKAHPITSDWVEGFGNSYNEEEGVTWNSNGLSGWQNKGGDFNDTITYDVNVDEEYQFLEIDLSDYINRVEGGENNFGIMLVSNEDVDINAYKVAMYSDDSPSGYDPFIQILHDDYSVDTSQTALYNGDFPIVVDVYNYRYANESDGFFIAQLNIKPKYTRNSLFYPDSQLYYLPDIEYRLMDTQRDKLIYDFSEYTRIPVKEKGLMLTFSTKNLKSSLYYLVCRYTHTDGTRYYSDRIYFNIK